MSNLAAIITTTVVLVILPYLIGRLWHVKEQETGSSFDYWFHGFLLELYLFGACGFIYVVYDLIKLI